MSPDPVLPRRARAADAPAVADLYLRARRAAVPDIPPIVHDDADVRAWIAGQLAGTVGGPTRAVWVATTAERPAAVLGILVTEDDWVEQLYVDPDLTGRGIGARLLDHAKALSPGRLQLWTFQSNARAQRFYLRHGFVEAERTDGADNEERAPDIRYTWERAPFPGDAAR